MNNETNEELRARIGDDAYPVLREGGTEAPFTGELYNHHEEGDYACKVCGTVLFGADAKFDSGTGWPSFDSAISGSVEFIPDAGYGMERTEVRCATCHSHLGRINSVCLNFKKK
jgi:peptide-methionine (R)-S-oxide reductase